MKKNKFVPQLNDINQELPKEDFAALLNSVSTSHVKEGSVVKGQVIEVTEEVVVVDVGLKNEGRIPIDEFKSSGEQKLPKVGDIVDVFVEKVEGRRGTVLSRANAIKEESWAKLEQIFAKKENVNGTIYERLKGGFYVDIMGVRAFLPGSQVDVRPVKDVSTLMNIEQPFQILKMDKQVDNIVVSRRAILEESRSEARDEMLSKIKEGMVVNGIVKNITDYGAFVDLGSVDGLLHVTDISWRRINHPSEVLTFGQEVKVMVIKFNEETKRISLGMKQLAEDPWKDIENEFPINKVMVGPVINVADYGAFIGLGKKGIEGLVHSSEISWNKANQNARKSLTIGQEVQFVILDIDKERYRISLSIKRCQENPFIKFGENHPVGSVITVPIKNITDFAMFVELDTDIDGMIHESNISWEGKGTELLKNYKKGDMVECKVLNVEADKIALGIKQLKDNPYEGDVSEFKKNSIVTCTVTEVKEDGIEVNIEGKALGFIKKVDLSVEKYEQKPERFAEGDRIDAKITAIDKATHKISLSIKALEIEERQKVIKEYGSTDSGASLGDILGAALGEVNSKDQKGK